MKVSIKTVSPKMAKKYLENNGTNRPISKIQLEMLIRVIEAGKWRLTHQGIAFYEDGELADGQHRLSAIVETQKSQRMPVFTGIKREQDTIMAIDSGKGRTARDSAIIAGVDVKGKSASIVRALEYGYAHKKRIKLSHFELIELFQRYDEELKIINELFNRVISKITITPVKVAVARAVSERVDIECARQFVETLITGEYDHRLFANAVKVRNALIETAHSGGQQRIVAYNMTYNALKETSAGNKIRQVSKV